MILIFDTFGGLVNQFYDINQGICFCNNNNIEFSFRHCSFRNNNLTSWTPRPFEELFDTTFLKKNKLYIEYKNIEKDINENNCENFKGTRRAITIYNRNNLLKQLISHNNKYVVLVQFCAVSQIHSTENIMKQIRPCKLLFDKYIEIKNNLIKEPYNYIHYRYEKDFTSHFKVTIDTLDNILSSTPFKKNKLKTFVATSNIQNLIDLRNEKYRNILFKDERTLIDLNFEQRAFIDYMFGLDSVECYGHSKSSFSRVINNLKGQNNYYA